MPKLTYNVRYAHGVTESSTIRTNTINPLTIACLLLRMLLILDKQAFLYPDFYKIACKTLESLTVLLLIGILISQYTTVSGWLKAT